MVSSRARKGRNLGTRLNDLDRRTTSAEAKARTPDIDAADVETRLATLEQNSLLLMSSNYRAEQDQLVTPQDWGGKSGPTGMISNYVSSWARGIDSGSTIDAISNANGIVIGLDGLYECRAFIRGSSTADYIGLALNGDRSAFEARSNNPGMVGVWTHDHASGTNTFSSSYYLGQLYAGDIITAGPPTTGTGILYTTAASSGSLTVRRLS